MKTLKVKFIAFLIVISGIAACDLDNGVQECTYNENNEVTAVTGPDTTTVGEEITLNVTVKMLRTCGEFDNFSENTGYPKNIYASIYYPDCNCTIQNTPITVPYTFSAASPGQYELRFHTTTNPIVKTITVTE